MSKTQTGLMKVSEEDFQKMQSDRAVDPSVLRGVLARIPPSWSLVQTSLDGAAFARGQIEVVLSVAYELDHRIWVHVSAAGFRKGSGEYLPTWEEMLRVKNDFIGEDKWAYQVFPSSKDYVNINPYVLHLFALLDGEPALPDFTGGTGSI